MKIKRDKCALLIIDMQNDFVTKGFPFYIQSSEDIIPNIKKLLQTFRERGLPVIYTAHIHKDPEVDGGVLAEWWPEIKEGKVLIAGTEGAKIREDIKPLPKEPVIYKQRYSAFYNTNLEVILRGYGVEDLIISGVMTNICCESTARDGFFRDFRIFFLADATSSSHHELHLATLKNLAYAFAYVTTTDEILKMIKP